jgi:hypothetical protein
MPRNFDDMLEEDLEFTVQGETFRMQYVRPEVLAQWEDEDDPGEESALQAINRLDQRIRSFLVPDDRDRWVTLRKREENAIPFVQLREIVRWMVETQSARPTQTPSASADGRGNTAASSTAKSRSREATPA